jgi:hypothetical protein
MISAVAGYYVLGGSWLLTGVVLALFEMRQERHTTALLMLLVTGIVPWASAEFLYTLNYRDAYGLVLPFGIPTSPLALRGLALLAPALVFSGLIWRYLKRWQASPELRGSPPVALGMLAPNSQQTNQGSCRSKASRRPREQKSNQLFLIKNKSTLRFGRLLSHQLAACVLAFAVVGIAHDPVARTTAQVDRAADAGNWGEVLRLAAKLSHADPSTMLDVNRALCHEGQLLDRMFSYPQRRGFSLWFEIGEGVDLAKLDKASGLLFELGHLNRAERMAAESLELNGPQPAILKRLFLVNVAKGSPDAAKPFLNLLSRSFWHGQHASAYRRAFLEDPLLSSDPEISAVRNLQSSRDYVGMIPNNVLMQITLREKPDFRPAFEYLISEYLLHGQVEKVAQNLDRIDVLGLRELPIHLEEALLIYEKLRPNVPLDLRGRTVRASTRQRYNEFNLACRALDANSPQANVELRRSFGNTYWFFFLFGHSGAIEPVPVGKSRLS